MCLARGRGPPGSRAALYLRMSFSISVKTERWLAALLFFYFDNWVEIMKQLGARQANWMPMVPGRACPRASAHGLRPARVWVTLVFQEAVCSAQLCATPVLNVSQKGSLFSQTRHAAQSPRPVMGEVFWDGEERGLKFLCGSFKCYYFSKSFFPDSFLHFWGMGKIC